MLWTTLFRMRWESATPTILNGMLVGIASAVLMLVLAGAGALDFGWSASQASVETIAR